MKKLSKILIAAAPSLLMVPVMLTSCGNKTMVKWVGHRGTPSDTNIMENTIDSFKKAASIDSYWGIETDIYPTLTDEAFVCVHDVTPFRDADGNRKETPVYSLTHEQALAENIMYSNNYPRDHQGYFDPIEKSSLEYEYHVADFEDYLDICLNSKKTAVIEIKIGDKYWGQEGCCWNEQNLKAMYDIVINYNKKGMEYCFISFDNLLLEYMHNTLKVDSVNHIQMLFDSGNTQDKKFQDPYWFADNGYSIDIGDLESESTTDWGYKIDKDLVDAFHKKGLLFNVWTVDTKPRVDALTKLGVDFITSDYPMDKVPETYCPEHNNR